MRPLVVCVVLMTSGSASALGVSIEGAGGVWFAPAAPQFQVTLAVHQPLGSVVALGLRSGVALNLWGGPPQVAIPIDVMLRFRIKRIFLEPLGGPWFLLGDTSFLRAHAGMAIGVLFGSFELSVEAGWLQPSALLLARFSFRF